MTDQATDSALLASILDTVPDAMVVIDDFMAFGAVTAARARYLKVPDHLGIVSFNNTSLCQLLEVGLTSVSLDIDRMVELAVRKLLSIIEDGEPSQPKREIVPCEVVERGSSKHRGSSTHRTDPSGRVAHSQPGHRSPSPASSQ